MTEQTTPPDGADQHPHGAAPEPDAAAERPHSAAAGSRTLRRSRDERMLAGVLGGLGRQLGIDPVLLRIVTAVLAIFGGVGIVIYAAGWLFIPDEDSERSIAEQALGRGHDRPQPATLWLAGGLVLAVLFAAGTTFGSGVGTLLLVLAAAGVIVLLRRDDDASAGRFAEREPDDGVADAAGEQLTPPEHEQNNVEPPAADPASANPPHEAGPPEGDAGSRPEYVHSFTAPVQPASAWPEPPDWPAADFDPSGFETPEPIPAGKPARSHLGALTLSAVAVALGILAINDVTYAVVPVSAYVALALAIIGAGLLIGSWFGRARSLIAWGLIGTFIALPVAAFGDFLDWDLSGEERTITIADVAELPAEPRSHGTGRVVYDLGEMEIADDEPIALDVSQNMGQLHVIVPPTVDVTVNAATGLGHIVAFDEQAAGNEEVTVIDTGPDGAGGGELTLDLSLDLGEIVVERAEEPAGDLNGQGVR